MIKVKVLLEAKGHVIHAVAPSDTVFEAIKRMAEHHCGALLVLEQNKLVGIVSERDYARKVILQGKSSKATAVSEIMSTKLVTTSPEHTLTECLTLMTQHRIRHLPVLDGERVAGVLSIGDLVKAKIEQQQREIQQLSQYIAGT
jgi:CBS domain-containing protein